MGPPPIETITPDALGKTDTGYALGVHMVGLHGAWHRLWAMLVLRAGFDSADDLDPEDDGLNTVRAQVGQALGRPITDEELSLLNEHALTHAAAIDRRAGDN